MADLSKFTILVVEDDEVLRNVIIFDLKRKGFNIIAAENGQSAFEVVKNTKVDLMLSDYRMPGGDGMRLLENIRAYNSTPPQVIFLTGYAEVTAEQALARGARQVIFKPFDRKFLIDSILDALGVSNSAEVA